MQDRAGDRAEPRAERPVHTVPAEHHQSRRVGRCQECGQRRAVPHLDLDRHSRPGPEPAQHALHVLAGPGLPLPADPQEDGLVVGLGERPGVQHAQRDVVLAGQGDGGVEQPRAVLGCVDADRHRALVRGRRGPRRRDADQRDLGAAYGGTVQRAGQAADQVQQVTTLQDDDPGVLARVQHPFHGRPADQCAGDVGRGVEHLLGAQDRPAQHLGGPGLGDRRSRQGRSRLVGVHEPDRAVVDGRLGRGEAECCVEVAVRDADDDRV